MSTQVELPAQVDEDRRLRHTVIPIFLLAVLIPLRGLHTIIPGFPDWPINTMAAIALAMVAAFYHSRWRMPSLLFAASGLGLWLALILPSTISQGDFDLRRAGSLTALFAIAYAMGSGRLHLDSLRRGIMTGLVVGAAVGIVQMQGATGYVGRLAGLLGDPNGVGFTVVTLGFVVAQRMASRRHLAILLAFMGAVIWLTQSRTTMFAALIAVSWVVLGRRIGRFASIVGLGTVLWLFQWASAFAEAQGWFTERLGSDNLRERLAITERMLTDSAGLWGHGLGTAIAEFDGIRLFFHNSYRALQTEGGIVSLVLFLVMAAALFWNFHSLPVHRRPVWAEAGLIAACICSMNIGYSLTSVPMAVAVGFYLAYQAQARPDAVETEEPAVA